MGKINYNALVEIWTEKDYQKITKKGKARKRQIKTYALDNTHYLGD